jgi:quinol monooxygenase YgiN
MNYVLIIHAVKDYPIWKEIFDNAASLRKDAGEQMYYVLRDENDANRVIHFSRWESISKAKAFFESPRLVEIRKQAGVEAPEFNYLHLLEKGDL